MDYAEKNRSKPLLDNNNEEHVDAAKTELGEAINVTWSDIKPQILIVNIGFMFTIQAGINLVFPNLVLKDFDINVNSWIAGIVGLSMPVGACTCGILMDRYGRKGTNIITGLPSVLSWILTAAAHNDHIWILYLGRFLAGVAGGMSTSNLVYVGEISHKKYRPLFLSLLSCYFSIGILLTTVLQWFLSWRQCSLFIAASMSIVTIITFYIPESPVWLINFHSDWDQAKKSLRMLYSNEKVFNVEWRLLRENSNCSKLDASSQREMKLFSPVVYKPIVALSILFLLQQISGSYVTIIYMLSIYKRLGPNKSKNIADVAFIIFGLIKLVTSVAGSFMSHHMKRKTMLLVSSLGMAVSYLLIVFSLYFKTSLPFDYEILALGLFLVYLGMGSLGVMTIPWTLAVELLPTEVRSKAGTILVSYAYILMFVLAKIFPFVLEWIGPELVFVLFTAMAVGLAIFSNFFIPETFGKSFDEIKKYFVE